MDSQPEVVGRVPAGSGDPGQQSSPPHGDDRWFRAMRRFIRRRPTLNLIYRTFVTLVGLSVIVLGIVLLPLPGPGWLIIFAGLAVLATEFVWAARLLVFARRKVLAWTHWVTRQSRLVRAMIGLAGLLALGLAAWAAWHVHVHGTPEWVPGVG